MTTQCPKCQSDNTDTAKFCSECATPLQPSKDIGITKTIETPVEERTALDYLNYLKVEPKFDYLRSEPRFQDVLRRIGLPFEE